MGRNKFRRGLHPERVPDDGRDPNPDDDPADRYDCPATRRWINITPGDPLEAVDRVENLREYLLSGRRIKK